MKDLAVLAISAVSAVIVGFIANANGDPTSGDPVGLITGMLFFFASLFFWGRLFAGERLQRLWLLLATMATAGLPMMIKSEGGVFICVVAAMLLITVDGLWLSKLQKKPVPRWTGEEPGAVWDPELDRRNQEIVDNYERSKGALIFDGTEQEGKSRHHHHH